MYKEEQFMELKIKLPNQKQGKVLLLNKTLCQIVYVLPQKAQNHIRMQYDVQDHAIYKRQCKK